MADQTRDEWSRRAGPMYPLLVAVWLQSRHAVAPRLSPTAEDIHRGRPWMLLVGLGVALLSSGAAWGFGLYRASPVAAVVVVVLCFLASLGYFEVGFARSAERLAAWMASGDTGSTARIAIPATLAISFLLPFAALVSLPASDWIAVVVCAQMVSRWSCLLADLSVDWRRDTQLGNPPRWMSFTIASTLGAGIVITLGGANGFLAILLAGFFAMGASATVRREPDSRYSMVAAAGWLSGMTSYLSFCL